jgi:DNA-binding MarR family transcriptional regulator
MARTHQHDIAACTRAWQTLRMAHNRVADRLGAELARACGLTLNEFDVLLYLRSHADEDVRISALLDAVSLSQPALSRLIARLEERDLLTRSQAEHDGRAIVVTLTAPGAGLTDRAIAIHARTVQETLTSKFTDAEQAALLQTLSQIGR